MTRVPLRAAFLLVLVFAATAAAQTATQVRPVSTGDKLRITMPDGRVVSAVAVSMSETTLQLRDGSNTRTVDLKTASRVERVLPDPIRNGLGWGLLIGGATGAALGAVSNNCTPGSFCIISRSESAMLLGLMGAGVGVAVGGVGDSRTHGTQVLWPRPVAPPAIAVSPMVSPRARGLSVLIRW